MYPALRSGRSPPETDSRFGLDPSPGEGGGCRPDCWVLIDRRSTLEEEDFRSRMPSLGLISLISAPLEDILTLSGV